MLGGPALTLPGAARRSVADLSGAAARLQHRPRRRRTRTITWAAGAAGRDRQDRGARAEDRDADGAECANIVPQGGLFWDGRADTLQIQASGPLLDPREMDGGSIEIIAEKLRNAPYARKFAALVRREHFQEPETAGRRGDVRGLPLSDRGAELPSLHQQVRLLAGGQGSPERERKCAAIACSTIRTKANCAGCHTSAAKPRRIAAALYRYAI